MRTGNIMIGAVKKATVTEIVRSNINRYSLKDDPYDVASDIGKKYNWSVKKIEQAERVIRKSYINGIGAVKKLEYNKEALNLLRMLKTVVKSAKDLNGVTVYPTSFGYWAVSRKGRGLFMVQQGSLSESTIKKYGLR